jgi:prepilin-type N-terminal cleavage/methylation domain-containing protein
MKLKDSSQQGFTLIETSIAMVVLLIALFGVAWVFLYSSKYNSGASDRAVAIAIAQQQMEKLRNTNYYSTELNATGSTGTTTTVTSAGLQYTVNLVITDTTATRKTIVINVTPVNPTSSWSQSPVTLTTQRADLSVCKVTTNCWL